MLDYLQHLVDSATGHKSTHYSTRQVQQYEFEKGQKEREFTNAQHMVETRNPTATEHARDVAKTGPNPESMYSHQQFGLANHQLQMESEATNRSAMANAAMKRIADQANTSIQNNNLANDTRINGKFTDQGLQLADRNANLNAQDRMKSKAMLGLGGSMINPYGPQGLGNQRHLQMREF